MVIKDRKIVIEPTPELFRKLYEDGFTDDEFLNNFGISTTKSPSVRDLLIRYFGVVEYLKSKQERVRSLTRIYNGRKPSTRVASRKKERSRKR